jgi:ubiquinone/menaquinone biosynthesis C-methylase UbiE
VLALVPLVASAGSDGGAIDPDPAVRLMLDPLRAAGLRPAELVARLHLRPRDVVADLGAGPGFLTLPLARAVPRGRVIATDVRPEYLLVAARRAKEAGIANLETLAVPADSPSLPPGSVDLALLCQVDQYLPDRARYLAALRPALRPGGRVAIVNYARYREADRAAARAAGLRVVDEWQPTPPFFLLVLAP